MTKNGVCDNPHDTHQATDNTHHQLADHGDRRWDIDHSFIEQRHKNARDNSLADHIDQRRKSSLLIVFADSLSIRCSIAHSLIRFASGQR